MENGGNKPDATSGGWLALKDRVCVVTGAGGGIGSAIAINLARAGARVALLDLNGDAAQRVADQIARAGGGAFAMSLDISDRPAVLNAAQICRDRLGPCTVLVNNAAAAVAGSIECFDIEQWNRTLAIDLTGYLLCSQAFGADMIQLGRGSMVHVGSLSGTDPVPYNGAYSVAKAGVAALSRQLAIELGGYGIRSNVVSPALVRTPLSEPLYADPEIARLRSSMVPLQTIASPQDIADAALFLASDRSGYISGQDLAVDGAFQHGMMGMVPRPGFDRQAVGKH